MRSFFYSQDSFVKDKEADDPSATCDKIQRHKNNGHFIVAVQEKFKEQIGKSYIPVNNRKEQE
jgi:hypothetical protein